MFAPLAVFSHCLSSRKLWIAFGEIFRIQKEKVSLEVYAVWVIAVSYCAVISLWRVTCFTRHSVVFPRGRVPCVCCFSCLLALVVSVAIFTIITFTCFCSILLCHFHYITVFGEALACDYLSVMHNLFFVFVWSVRLLWEVKCLLAIMNRTVLDCELYFIPQYRSSTHIFDLCQRAALWFLVLRMFVFS